jgi:dGTP triphosphohydrolase
MIKASIQVQSLKQYKTWELKQLLQYPLFHQPARLQTMIIILNILNMIKRVILIHVHREKFSEPTEYGTRNIIGGIMSLFLSNTRRVHANYVLHIHSAPGQKKEECFQEAHLQNITKEIARTLRRKSTSINAARLLLNIPMVQ